MSSKLVFTITLFFYCQTNWLVSCDIIDAQAAYYDLKTIAEEAQNNFTKELNTINQEMYDQMMAEYDYTLEIIHMKYREIYTKVMVIQNNTNNANVTDFGVCSFFLKELEDFPQRYSERALNCTNFVSSMLWYRMSEKFYRESVLVVDDLLLCYNESLQQCILFGDAGCSDFVIEKTQEAKDNILGVLKKIRADYLNHVVSFKYPCQSYLQYQMAVDPVVQLQPVVDCLENELIRLNSYSTCPH